MGDGRNFLGYARVKRRRSITAGESGNVKASSMAENFQDYLLNSTLHGLRYIGTGRLATLERTFFSIAFLIVTILSAYFISNVWQKYTETPVIIGLNPIATDLNTIPFPAVTICNMNQARKSIAQQMEGSELDKSILESFCLNTNNSNSSGTANAGGRWSYVRSILLKVAQPCKEMLLSCTFANVKVNCGEVFQSSLTDEGLCCKFNGVHESMLSKSNENMSQPEASANYTPIAWNPEDGYAQPPTKMSVPRMAAGAGSQMGLSVILDANVNEYYCSSTDSSGFKILLHNPNETPKLANTAFFVGTGEETRVEVRPRISDAANHIRRVQIRQRQCIFASEANLSFFKSYSKKNCEMECESQLVEAECGCALYYMPKSQEDTQICSRSNAACYEKVQLSINDLRNKNFSCQCMPGCFEIAYNQVLSQARLGTGSFLVLDNIFELRDKAYVEKNLAVVRIFFLETSFRSFRKEELVGFTEFLSNTGGLLGLFMGFSVISLMEIVYYCTLRPYYAHQRYMNHHIGNAPPKTVTLAWHTNQEMAGGHPKKSIEKPSIHGMGSSKSKWKLINLMNRILEALKRQIKNVGDMARRNQHIDNDEQRYPYFE